MSDKAELERWLVEAAGALRKARKNDAGIKDWESYCHNVRITGYIFEDAALALADAIREQENGDE